MEKSQLLNFVYGLVALYVLIGVLLYFFQRFFIYMPTPEYQHGFKQITIESESESVNVIVLNSGNDNAFIYFGGNAEAVVANGADFTSQFPKMTVYLVNYRGYGGSSGKPTESGLFADAIAVFDAISGAHQDIAVMGRSLGSGVAMHLAANRPVSHLALITPYDSVLALARKQYPIFPISLLLRDKYDSMSIAKNITAPVLALSGGNDTLIPVSHAKTLVEEIGDNAKLVVIEQASHNDISNFAMFYQNLRPFFHSDNEF